MAEERAAADPTAGLQTRTRHICQHNSRIAHIWSAWPCWHSTAGKRKALVLHTRYKSCKPKKREEPFPPDKQQNASKKNRKFKSRRKTLAEDQQSLFELFLIECEWDSNASFKCSFKSLAENIGAEDQKKRHQIDVRTKVWKGREIGVLLARRSRGETAVGTAKRTTWM